MIGSPDHRDPIGCRGDERDPDEDVAAVDEVIEAAQGQWLEASAERQPDRREGGDDRQEEDRERGHDVEWIVHPRRMVAERPELLHAQSKELEQADREEGADHGATDPGPPGVGHR